MTFDEWWSTQNPDHLDELTAREAFQAGVDAGQEAAADRIDELIGNSTYGDELRGIVE